MEPVLPDVCKTGKGRGGDHHTGTLRSASWLVHSIGARTFPKLALEKTVEKRELVEAVGEGDGADGFRGVEQRAADGLEAHLIQEG